MGNNVVRVLRLTRLEWWRLSLWTVLWWSSYACPCKDLKAKSRETRDLSSRGEDIITTTTSSSFSFDRACWVGNGLTRVPWQARPETLKPPHHKTHILSSRLANCPLFPTPGPPISFFSTDWSLGSRNGDKESSLLIGGNAAGKTIRLVRLERRLHFSTTSTSHSPYSFPISSKICLLEGQNHSF